VISEQRTRPARTGTTYYRLAVGVALATVLFLVLAMGALGIIGAGGRPDRVYAAVLGVLVIGTIVARLQPAGMALALVATAFAQALVTVTALLAGLHQVEGGSVVDILWINAIYVALFSFSAWLFRRAAEQQPAVAGDRA
jgi:hypothetical protein